MSESSGDSDSSCGWTIVSHEGSHTEMVTPPITNAEGCEPSLEAPSREQAELQELQGESVQDGTSLGGEIADLAFETEEEKLREDNVCFGTASDDSDIVTLEPPKLGETGIQDMVTAEEARGLEDFSMGSSSSSRYTFCQPEAALSAQHSEERSSSEQDEPGQQRSPALRRRRARRRAAALAAEWEERDPGPWAEPPRRQCGRGLGACMALALVVVAVSVGLGRFYGTIQSQRQQQLGQKTPEVAANDMKRYLHKHPQELEPPLDARPLKEMLRQYRLLTTAEKKSLEIGKKRLATQNYHLRGSLEKRARAMGSLQEEVQKLREQVRILEEEGTGPELILENQKLKQYLEDAKQKGHWLLSQRESLLAETQVLRSELERAQKVAASLRKEILQRQPGQWQAQPGSPQEEEVALLRERVSELEQKLSFEQQRSYLWERLYIEAKDQHGKPDAGKQKASRGHHRAKSKSKETLLGTVKETFDAMKNSTKEFVRHHKEKIKQAKEAVKENLKKFSESVKSTFRHFKDTTKTIFDKQGNKRFGATKETGTEKKKPVFSDCSHPQCKAPSPNHKPRGPSTQRDQRRGQPARQQEARRAPSIYEGSTAYGWQGHCRSSREAAGHTFESAQQESFSPCNTVVNPVLIGEFRQVIRTYLLKELGTFHHWEELNEFINQFVVNNLFSNHRKIFADFVNDVKEYLKSMKEYQAESGTFEKLDGYICRHVAGSSPAPHRPSQPDKKQRMVNVENSRHQKRAEAPSAAAL
uniref:Cell cycle progression 1 n=1 Tax=Chinchilla lanigera TaxID=34839 RepID=A0A8C2V9H4_CHILA